MYYLTVAAGKWEQLKWVIPAQDLSWVVVKLSSWATVNWKFDWGWNILFQDGFLTWMLAESLSSSLQEPLHRASWVSSQHQLVSPTEHDSREQEESFFLFFFGHVTWHEGSWFPDQWSNPCPLQWKRGVIFGFSGFFCFYLFIIYGCVGSSFLCEGFL